MKIQYQILKEKNLLIQKYIGHISFEDYETYISHMHKMMKDPDWESVEKSLVDLRETDLDLSFENIKKLSAFRSESMKKKYSSVFLVEKPSATASAHLYQDELKKSKTDYKYCSTMQQALSLLKLDMQEDEMEDILSELKG